VSEKNYIFMFPNGDGAEYSSHSNEDAINFAKDEFDGVDRITIHRVTTGLHEIGTVENGVFTAAEQEPVIEGTLAALLAALVAIKTQAEVTATTFPNAPGRGDFFAIARWAQEAVTKAKGGAL